jgi:hypothetical protein
MIIVLQYRPLSFMNVNYDHTVITIVNYDRKTFIAQATAYFKTQLSTAIKSLTVKAGGVNLKKLYSFLTYNMLVCPWRAF